MKQPRSLFCRAGSLREFDVCAGGAAAVAYNEVNAYGNVVHLEGDKPLLSTSLVRASIANAVAAAQKVVEEAQKDYDKVAKKKVS